VREGVRDALAEPPGELGDPRRAEVAADGVSAERERQRRAARGPEALGATLFAAVVTLPVVYALTREAQPAQG
jgi:hypothetical protein